MFSYILSHGLQDISLVLVKSNKSRLSSIKCGVFVIHFRLMKEEQMKL